MHQRRFLDNIKSIAVQQTLRNIGREAGLTTALRLGQTYLWLLMVRTDAGKILSLQSKFFSHYNITWLVSG